MLTNSSEALPGNAFGGVQTPSSTWSNLAAGLTPLTTANTPIVWAPLYNFAVKPSGAAHDFALPVIESSGKFKLRLVTVGPFSCVTGGTLASTTPHPVFGPVTQSSAAFVCDPVGNTWNPTCGVATKPTFSLNVKDGWANDLQANAIEVTVTRHTGPLLTNGNVVTGAKYVYSTPPAWQTDGFYHPLPVYNTTSNDGWQAYPLYFMRPAYEEWFGQAYVFEVRRIKINGTNPTPLRAWETYTMGISFAGSAVPLTSLGALYTSPPYNLTPDFININPPTTNPGTWAWLRDQPGANAYAAPTNLVRTFTALAVGWPVAANPNTNAGPVPLSQRPPPVPPNMPAIPPVYGGTLP